MTQDLFREVSTSLTSVTSLSLHSLLNFAVKINCQWYVVISLQNSSLSRTFKLFRALGLRHIVVVDENNEVSEPGY